MADDARDARTTISDATRDEERRQARQAGGADRAATPDEERAAERNQPDPEVASHEREMLERGAAQPGEGRITP